MTLHFCKVNESEFSGTIELRSPEEYQTTLKGDVIAEVK